MCRLLAGIGHSGRRQSVSGRIRAFTRRKRTNVDSRALPGGVERAGGRAHHADQAPRRLSAVVSGGGLGNIPPQDCRIADGCALVAPVFLRQATQGGIGGSKPGVDFSELRSAAALDKEVMLLGMGGCFEIWDAHTYIAKERIAMTQEMPDALKHFTF